VPEERSRYDATAAAVGELLDGGGEFNPPRGVLGDLTKEQATASDAVEQVRGSGSRAAAAIREPGCDLLQSKVDGARDAIAQVDE
jgi:hypothetical protein